jgi:hypothetical protein
LHLMPEWPALPFAETNRLTEINRSFSDRLCSAERLSSG